MKTAASGWEDVARSHGRTVFSAARQLAGDDDSAWDCVQEAFVTALRRGAADVEEPVGWLCGVARNHARNLRRSRRRWRRVLGRLALHGPKATSSPTSESEESLNTALSTLPAAQREAVVLRYLGEMSTAEVAAAQRVSEAAVKARVHRGLSRLRRRLGATALLLAMVRTASGSTGRKRALLEAARTGGVGVLTAATAARFLLPFLVVGAGYLAFRDSPLSPPAAPEAGPATASILAGGFPALQAPVAAPKNTKRVVYRDLLDGRPLPGFAVKIGKHVHTSGPDGAVEIPPTLAPVAPAAAEWVLGSEPDRVTTGGGTLWFGRRIKVRGRVTVPADFDLPLTEVSVAWRFRDGGRAPGSAGLTDTWTEGFRAINRLARARRSPRSVRADPDGTFELDAFAVRDLYVSAHVRGWIAAVGDVRISDAGAPARVEVGLRDRAIRLHGTVRGRDGAPMRNLSIRAFVTQRMTAEEYRRTYFPLPGHGLTASVGKEGAIVNHHAGGRTGPSGDLGPGRFEILLGIPGDILIVAYPPGGYAAVEHRVRREIGDDGRVRIPLRWVGEGAQVTLTSEGNPIGPGRVTLIDYSLDGPQTQFSLPVGEGGRMPTALLTPGHRYRVNFRASPRPFRYLEWQPVERLEIDELPTSHPWLRKR